MLYPTKRPFIAALVAAVISFAIACYFTFSKKTILTFLAYVPNPAQAQLFWKKAEPVFTQDRSIGFKLKSGFKTYHIPLPRDTESLSELRLDPGNVPNNKITIHYIILNRPGFVPVYVPLSSIQAVSGIKESSVSNTLTVISSSNDPILRFPVPSLDFKLDWGLLLLYLAVSISLGCLVFFSWGVSGTKSFSFSQLAIVSSFLLIFGLSFSMALKAPFNASPDERDHFMAAEFFKSNTDTPQVKEELGAYTYNPLWSYSRVYQKGLHYLLAGKFSNLFDRLAVSYKSVRLFGVSLLLIFAFLAFRFAESSAMLLPLLITPQVWYLFSYINDGFFPLFLSFILIVFTEIGRKHFASFKWNLKPLLLSFIVGAAMGMLYLSRSNYIIFLLFYLSYLLLLPLSLSEGLRKGLIDYGKNFFNFAKVLLVILGVALVTVGARTLAVNTGNHSTELTNNVSEYYKKTEEERATLLKKDRAHKRFGTYTQMLQQWIPLSYKSFNGGYGFLEHFGGETFYLLLIFLHAWLLAAILFFTFIKGSADVKLWATVSIVTAVLMIFASSYIYSYNYNYQPQGRYLFPLLPVLGVLFFKLKSDIKSPVLALPIVLLFLMSVYSFMFVAFVNL